MVSLRTPRKRHLRHGQFPRTSRSKHLRAFTTDRASDLAGTGAAKTFTAAGILTALAATGLLTISSQPGDGVTVTIGSVTYTFNTVLGGANSILRGADATASRDNLVAAIMHTAGEGTTYGTGTVAHPLVTAAASGANMTVTAKTAGAAGNSIATTETGSTIGFGAATLTGGRDAVTAASNLTMTAHGLSAGAGPFLLTTTTTLPAGLQLATPYWVSKVVDANTLQLATARAGAPAAVYTSAGTGTHTATKASDDDAIFEYLRQNDPAVVLHATDVDAL